MKKYARIFSMLALILAITFVFSGCGVIDYAKSILIKEESTTLPATTIAGEIVYTDAATDSALIAPPSDTASDAVPDTVVNVQVVPATTPGESTNTDTGSYITPSESADSSEAVTSGNTEAAASHKKPVASASTTKKPVSVTVPDTTKKNNKVPTTNKKPSDTLTTTKELTAADIQEMPLKDVQDLLFASESADKTVQILTACGFEYDEKQGIYYSSVNPWQKGFGFNVVYDMTAPLAGMYYSTERIYFRYDNKDWMIQLWKGQYGITAGAEIGIYNKTDKIMQYDCASEDEFLEMSFDFYNQDKLIFSRGPEKHWWLTGFKIFNAGVPILIDLDMTIKFPTKSMADAFEGGLKKANKDNLLDPMTYTRTVKTFKIHW